MRIRGRSRKTVFFRGALFVIASGLIISSGPCVREKTPASAGAAAPSVSRGYSIPLIDISGQTGRQAVVDREPRHSDILSVRVRLDELDRLAAAGLPF